MSESRPQGPNVRRLIAHKMSQLIVPRGGGELARALSVLMKPNRLREAATQATKWAEEALALVKTSPDNPFGGNDEAIAGEILRQAWLKMGPTTCPKCGGSRIRLGSDKYHCGRCN